MGVGSRDGKEKRKIEIEKCNWKVGHTMITAKVKVGMGKGYRGWWMVRPAGCRGSPPPVYSTPPRLFHFHKFSNPPVYSNPSYDSIP